MVTYEVTTTVEPHLVEAFERYMRDIHIPDLLATGCFQAAAFTRSAPGRYRVRYEASSQAELDRYLTTHATRLRAELVSLFPEGVTASREVWVSLQRWNSEGSER
jgi:quinol monooxygenase YgiN